MTALENVEDIYPLSPMQHLMLLHTVAARQNGILLNQVTYDIRGALDIDAFRKSWEAVVAQHPALRTAFVWEGLDEPLQVVRETADLSFRLVDLSSVDDTSRKKRTEQLGREDVEAPMTLAQAPLMRCTVVRFGVDSFVFIWTVHHLVVDRWSHGLIFADLERVYRSLVNNEPAKLPAAARFRDYIEWALQQDMDAAERYWHDELSGVQPAAPFADGGPARDVRRTQTSHVLSVEDSRTLRACAASWRTTPAAILMAAAGLTWATLAASDDVVIGITVSGRPPELPDVAGAVGTFVNNLPARITIDRSQRMGEWIRQLQRAQLRRQAFAHVSLVDIQRWSALPPAQPLFDLLVLVNLTDDSNVTWTGLELVPTSATLDAGYRFLLSLTTEEDRVVLTLVHDQSFDDATRLLDLLGTTIRRISTSGEDAVVGDVLPETITPRRRLPRASMDRDVSRSNGDSHMANAQAAGSALETALLDTWREVLGVEKVGPDDDFFVLGGTSLQAAQLFARIEQATGRTLPLSALLRARTVRALLELIGEPLSKRGPLIFLRSSGRRAPLYVLPGVSGHVVGLSAFADALGDDQPVGAFESPGLDGTEAPLPTIESIASRYVDELLATTTQRFHLLGLCWGAAVAFEMARQLSARGRHPASIMLLDPAELFYQGTGKPKVVSAFVRNRLEVNLDAFRKADWRGRAQMLSRKASRVAKVIARREHLNETRFELHQARVGAANLAAFTRYKPEALTGAACIFMTADRDLEGSADWRLEWLKLISPPPRVVEIGGSNTGEAMLPPHLDGFVDAVNAWIDIVDQLEMRQT